MGSFNTSCFVSRQTIATDDPCLVVPIRQQRDYNPVDITVDGQPAQAWGAYNSTCYPTRFWEPMGTALEAKYYDYGRFELLDTPANRTALVMLIADRLRQSPAVAQGENQYHDVPFDLPAFMGKEAAQLLQLVTAKRGEGVPTFDKDVLFKQALATWDYIFEVAQEQRLFTLDYKGHVRPMQFAVMHRAAYDALVAQTNAAVGWDKESYEMRAFFDRAIADMRESLSKTPEFGDLSEEKAALSQAFFAGSRLRDYLQRVGGSELRMGTDESMLLTAGLQGLLSGKLTEDELFVKLKPVLEARYAYSALEALNLHYEPMVYASQDYDNSIGRDYAKFVSQVSRAVTRTRAVSSYGDFHSYTVTVASRAAADALAEFVNDEYDAALEVVEVVPQSRDTEHCQLRFNVTLEKDDAMEMLADFNAQSEEAPRAFQETLTEAPNA